MGVAIMMQCALGLRPGELLHLVKEDIAISPDHHKSNVVIIRLGHGKGTKAGREQFTLLNIIEYGPLWRLISIVLDLTPQGQRLFPFVLSTYGNWIKQAQVGLALPWDLTPHSPRVGFASDAIAKGVPPPVIKEQGRWISESSFRIYIDVIGSLKVSQNLAISGRLAAVRFIRDNLHLYFNAVTLDAYGGSGVAVGEGTWPVSDAPRRGGRGGGAVHSGRGRGRGSRARTATPSAAAGAEPRGGARSGVVQRECEV